MTQDLSSCPVVKKGIAAQIKAGASCRAPPRVSYEPTGNGPRKNGQRSIGIESGLVFIHPDHYRGPMVLGTRSTMTHQRALSLY